MFNIRSVFGACLASLWLFGNVIADVNNSEMVFYDVNDDAHTYVRIVNGTVKKAYGFSSNGYILKEGSFDGQTLVITTNSAVVTSCASTISSTYTINYDAKVASRTKGVDGCGGSLASNYDFKIKIVSSSESLGQVATVNSGLDIHIPSATFGSSNIWVDLEYNGVSGFDHLWKLKDYGVNQ